MEDIVLLSGGMDSATCLAEMIHEHGKENIIAVGFNYGQKHSVEHEYSKKIADYFGVKLINLDIDRKTFTGSKSALLAQNADINIAHKSYTEMKQENGNGPVDTYIPFRNGLMLAQAASLAFSLGAKRVVYGAQKNDFAGDAYPDCSPEFYRSMNDAIYYGTGKKVKLYAPVLDTDKAGVVERGAKLHVPFKLTRSCYEGGDKDGRSCGECATCQDRIRAFKKNQLIDPIPYQIAIDWRGCKEYVQ